MSKGKMIGRTLLAGGAGYLVGCVLGIWDVPEYITLLFPLAGSIYGIARSDHKARPTMEFTQPEPQIRPERSNPLPEPGRNTVPERPARNAAPPTPQPAAAASAAGVPAQELTDIPPVFQPVLEYLNVLEEMIISEGQKHNLDNEIVEKSCSLFLRLQRVIPMLAEMHNDDINHTVKRLVLKDLNSVINPFLRLSGEAKTKNRRILLDGIKDVDKRITQIVKTIEHKDLIELQSRAEIIHQRYS
ncbi:hypothetical protein [Paenibacillus shenyangensis]|uniref:hypothetical protein n=1 Tax=Paenibacillus sp. A9 TaxID=1284352 RepID=UPI00035F4FA5|nr:hypothetical protein [Paenibacillus sp. A9]